MLLLLGAQIEAGLSNRKNVLLLQSNLKKIHSGKQLMLLGCFGVLPTICKTYFFNFDIK